MARKNKSVLLPVGNGSDALESSAIIKVCRMAGLSVDIASVEEDTDVTLLPGMNFRADYLIKKCKKKYDAIILPGGIPGCEALRDNETLKKIVSKNRSSALMGAICAAPAIVLANWEMLNVPATCNPLPSLRDILDKRMEVPNNGVVVSDDKTQVTASGAPFSIAFAVKIVQMLLGDEVACKMADAYLFDREIVYECENEYESEKEVEGTEANVTVSKGCKESSNDVEVAKRFSEEWEVVRRDNASRKRRRSDTMIFNVIQITR